MGGNALKAYGVTRISHPEYLQRVQQLHTFMKGLPNGVTCEYFIPGGVVKDDHGDLDVLYYSNNPTAVVDYLKRVFGSTGFKKNGNCTSIEWRGFQVDLINTGDEKFNMACHYYAHGTYAALLGKLARYYGFKLGWNGLYFTVKTKNRNYDELITTNWQEAIALLGYEFYLDPTATFDVHELYEHLIGSPLISKRVYRTSRPDRNYGFQEDFFEWIDKQAQVPDNAKSRAYGWCLVTRRDLKMGLRLLKLQGNMMVWEILQPYRKKIRKWRFTKVDPFLYKCRGWM